MKQLITSLKENRDKDTYPFHMPGHKRRLADDELLEEIYGIDITEIEGFDDLHNADGILKEAEERAAALYGADETHFLVNGSTGGILAAITAQVTAGDRIAVAANCHRSVFNAVMLSGADLYVIKPEEEDCFGISGGIEADAVGKVLDNIADTIDHEHRTTVVITSPTYEGITSDIRAIAGICHEKGAVLIVDEAHGAHFGLSDYFPKSAVSEGADVVITSVHKTLPAMTQTALIHIANTCPARERIRRMLTVFMTSSPSYVLMASIDSLTNLLKVRGSQLFAAYERRLDDLYIKAEQFTHLWLFNSGMLTAKGSADHDRGRIVIGDRTGRLSGKKLYDILNEKYGIVAEMAGNTYAVLITSIADTDEGFLRLYEALSDIDRTIGDADFTPQVKKEKRRDTLLPAYKAADIKAALFAQKTEKINIELAKGRIAAEMITVYPPGIPVTLPGQVISENVVDTIVDAAKCNLTITGLSDKEINVIWERSST